MKIKLLILVAALPALFAFKATAQTPTAPAQAAAVGFSNLVFDDEFSSASTIAPSTSNNTAGYNWYRYTYGNAVTNDVAVNAGTLYAVNGTLTSTAPASPTAAQTATGVLTIDNSSNNFNAVLQSIVGDPTGATRTGTWQHAYFEARIQFNPTVTGNGGPNGGWPSFWLWAVQTMTPSSGTESAENDILEYYPNGKAGSDGLAVQTMHNWVNQLDNASASQTYDTGDAGYNDMVSLVGSSESAQPTDGNWHTYGCLWVQTSATAGYIEYYYDGYLVVHQGGVTRFLTGTNQALSVGQISGTTIGTGLTAMEANNMFIYLGTAQGWPINVDYVRVWQGSTVTGTTAQTVSSFPSTLSLSTTQSPYTLPATTSAGLTLSYSVASGPATVSGNTLTLTGAGTVVLNATQAGNATYAAYSGTETITVTAPALTAQTVSNFPSTLSLSTSQSPYTLPATTSAGLTLSYSVTSGSATASGNTLTLTGTGTVVVKAKQAGNATYAAYSGTETITVTAPTLTTQTVSNFPSTLSLSTASSPYTLPATTSAALTISYSVASGPASVSGNTLTLTGAGTVVLNATQAGNATYAAYSGTETITVTTAAQTVSNFPATQTLTQSASPYTLPATTADGLTVTYTVVSGPATISGDTLTITGSGTVVLQATQAGNALYAPFSATETITVTAPVTATSFSAWQALFFTSAQLADPTISGPTADPYGSGVPNLLAYALQLNPATAQSADVPTAAPGNGHLVMTYFVPASITDISYIPEVSTDMVTWYSGAGYVQVNSNVSSASGNTITVQDTLPTTTPTHFMHLRVTQLP